ncbi:hypothetical protein [Clostridium estertheticum]|nr:hypothetical protein [Clostridium estertheticum]
MILSYLSIDRTTNKVERFNNLDPSEKACISYCIGLIMPKLFNVP